MGKPTGGHGTRRGFTEQTEQGRDVRSGTMAQAVVGTHHRHDLPYPGSGGTDLRGRVGSRQGVRGDGDRVDRGGSGDGDPWKTSMRVLRDHWVFVLVMAVMWTLIIWTVVGVTIHR